ncbi:MAG: hypothetical protein ACFFAN_04565 [Promethearchaeota archaeon]
MVKPKIFFNFNIILKIIVFVLYIWAIIEWGPPGERVDLYIIHIVGFILGFLMILCYLTKNYEKFKASYYATILGELIVIFILSLIIIAHLVYPENFNLGMFCFVLTLIIMSIIASIMGLKYFFSKRAELQRTKPIPPPFKDNIELKRGVDFVGGLIRYKVAIKNSTETMISNIELSLKMAARHIRIVDIKPRVYKKSDRALIENIPPGQSLSIDFYLEPMICGTILVAPVAIFIDAWGKTRTLTKESINVISKCPPIINAGEENIAKVENIYSSENIIRSFRSFELEHNPKQSFSLLMEAIGAWAGKHVSEPIINSETPFKAEVYYYVLNQNPDSELGHQEQIILKINVDEENNLALINVGAEKNETVNGVLTHIWELANTRFSEVFGFEFESLHCPECGASIKYMYKNRLTVICEYCGTEFEKKALK